MVFLTPNLLQWNSPGSTKEYKTDQQVKKKEMTICALEDIIILQLILVVGYVDYICKFLMSGSQVAMAPPRIFFFFFFNIYKVCNNSWFGPLKG